ncbi:hypothetical protein NECAME_14553 [Necator americanus]|uniref:Uncharacterized protein n=1 Tax=Necator americanus TaxID=51031 RepID=W2SPI7_NECAM|nr:hypothetical protein NECAME_14553 [Necator americanus]ETN70751.1 hypothetical protein NECAME_14553 [Necator americanus]
MSPQTSSYSKRIVVVQIEKIYIDLSARNQSIDSDQLWVFCEKWWETAPQFYECYLLMQHCEECIQHTNDDLIAAAGAWVKFNTDNACGVLRFHNDNAAN